MSLETITRIPAGYGVRHYFDQLYEPWSLKENLSRYFVLLFDTDADTKGLHRDYTSNIYGGNIVLAEKGSAAPISTPLFGASRPLIDFMTCAGAITLAGTITSGATITQGVTVTQGSSVTQSTIAHGSTIIFGRTLTSFESVPTDADTYLSKILEIFSQGSIEIAAKQQEQKKKNAAAIALLQSWLDETDPVQEREQKESLASVMKGLDEHRKSGRKLFP